MARKKTEKKVHTQTVESLQQPECIAPSQKTLPWMNSTWWIVTKDLILQLNSAQEYVSGSVSGGEKAKQE